jgi:alkylation response protein AidB-like acyl-CoA dehydrogenase
MFDLTDDQHLFLRSVRDIATTEFEDKAFSWGDELPWDHIQILADNGFMGVNFDEEFGGGGMSEFEVMLMIEAIGRVCPDTGSFLVNQQLVAPRAIAMFGTDHVKQTYLPPVIAGKEYIAVAISEPGAGSDVRSMSTTVQEQDGELVANGEKSWVSDFPDANAAVTWVQFPEGLGTVLLDLEHPGIEVARHSTNMAGKTQTHFYINNVPIPQTHVLTRGEDAFREQLKSLNWERLGGATLANTIALSAFDRALEYAQKRHQFDQQISEFQGIEWKLAEMIKQLELSRSYTFQSAAHAARTDQAPDPLETSIAKLYSGMVAEEVVSEALQVHGARGYQQDHPLEYLYRLARGRRIAGGTTEIQRNLIASQVKRHGPPSFL